MNEPPKRPLQRPRTRAATAGLGALVLAMLCMLHAAAHAQDTGDSTPRPTNPEALRLLDEGYRLYETGEFEKAIEIYKRGAKIEPGPRFHFNLGQCFRRLRKYDQAIFHFERVASDPRVSETVRQYADNFIRDMRAELANAASSNPPTGPAESLDADHTEGGEKVLAAPDSSLTEVNQNTVRWYHDRLGWSVATIGSAALLTGAVLEIRASSLYDQADRESAQDEILALKDRARSHRIWGFVALGAGGVALAAGVVRLALVPEPKDSRGPAGAALTIGTNWIGISGHF